MTKNEPKEGHILTLETEKSLFEGIILSKLLAGESMVGVWLPHSGMRKFLVYLKENADSLGFGKLGKYKIVFVSQDEATGQEAESIFKLMLAGLGEEVFSGGTFDALKKQIQKETASGIHIIFLFNHFDEIALEQNFFNNLKSLWFLDKQKVHFIFASGLDICLPENLNRFGSLKEVICQNIFYFPLFSKEDGFWTAERLCQKYKYRVEKEEIEKAVLLSGGHPGLLKAILRFYSEFSESPKDKNKLGERMEIRIIFEGIWTVFSEEEKTILREICLGKKVDKEKISGRLLNQRIVVYKENKPLIFSELFSKYILSLPVLISIELDSETENILLNGKPAKEDFTLKEYDLLVFFLKNKGQIISRDQIGDLLWGVKAFEKYSDWAIDQIVSQLRKKLTLLGANDNIIQTVRNRGYRWMVGKE